MNVLYISYDGALDPLGSSQIISYLIDLTRKGIKFTLITYEKKEKMEDMDRVRNLKKILENQGIKWEALRYHKSPTLPATTLDIVMGIIKGAAIVIRDRINFIHARSFVGAIPGFLLAKLFGLKFIFDMRGFWADERVDGNIWKTRGFLYKFAKWWEKLFLLHADWVICLTQEAKIIAANFPYLRKKKILMDVIPTCVDTSKFTIRNKDTALLKKINLQDRFVFVYFGSIGTWYMLDEMINFFKISKRTNPRSFFLLLSPQKDIVLEKMIKNNVRQEDYFIDYVPYKELPFWLSLADASISFIKPAYSKRSSCPTKFSEALACGLPVVINRGIGDTDKFVNNFNIGVVVKEFSDEEYIKAINQLSRMLEEGDNLKATCRKVAEDCFSLTGGVEKYWKIYQKLIMPK